MPLPAGLGVPKRRLEGLKGLRPGKQQAWIKSYWWGPGAFACGVGVAKKASWQTAGLNANKKRLLGPWCLCLRGWGCQKGIWSVWRILGLANGRRERQEKAIDVAFACGVGGAKLGPSQLSAHRWTSTWDLPSSVRTAGPQPGTFPAQCAPLDLNGQRECMARENAR